MVVAEIERAHGLEGGVIVRVETDYPDETFQLERAFGVTGAGPLLNRQLTLAAVQPHGGGLLLHFEELKDRTLAERYRGAQLTLPREELAAMDEGEFLLHDLLELEVRLESGETVGTVTAFYDAPSTPLLAVYTEENGEQLVPFDREVVKEVDLEEGVIAIDPPGGLLEM
ncbi:MAG: ribosome maturation factor RimM [Gemmatimonadota bacterium]